MSIYDLEPEIRLFVYLFIFSCGWGLFSNCWVDAALYHHGESWQPIENLRLRAVRFNLSSHKELFKSAATQTVPVLIGKTITKT